LHANLIRTLIFLAVAFSARAASLPVLDKVESQPLVAQVRRLGEAMDSLGAPFDPKTTAALVAAMNAADASTRIQQLLDPYCLFFVQINPESRAKVAVGAAKPELVEAGWRPFLVKVQNDAGATGRLNIESPNAKWLANSPREDVPNRWLDLLPAETAPLQTNLSGLRLEYRIVSLYSRDAGAREAKFIFDVGQGTQDVGGRGEASILFNCLHAQNITFRILDEINRPTTGCFEIRDGAGRIYPSQAKRLAPDFAFQKQIYRTNGEVLKLPTGVYDIKFSHGPESLPAERMLVVQPNAHTAVFTVRRWVDPSLFGWWSGDHHIHAAGCAHYDKPTEGVFPADMLRQCMGEDVKIGCTLTWGPGFDFQKQFFCGGVDKVSQYPYLLRYDVEVSGFGSDKSGHLCLLRLRDQIYPGCDSDKHWPTLGLSILKWAKKQNAVCGPAHSGYGLKVEGTTIPSLEVPAYDGIGANEYIVDVTHEVPDARGQLVPAVDFLSLCDTPYPWELTMWYHTLNAGFRTRCSGETDFPCIYDERVGMGRSYVKLFEKVDYDQWCEGIRRGRSYVSDGRSHIMDFAIEGRGVGEMDYDFPLGKPGIVKLTAKIAAYLPPVPTKELQSLPVDKKPFWHLERARIGNTREVPIELIVNGKSVETTNIVADGVIRDVVFPLEVKESCWVALRILPSSHSNPIWISVDDKPMVPRRSSVEWCLKGVDQCFIKKLEFINENEIEDAKAAYEHARQVYRSLLTQAVQ
jgi:hypothetical protein